MQRLGFIHDMMDVKVLILFVAARASYPMTAQEVYELCYQDECLSYFDVCTALPEMVESGHLNLLEDEKYEITEKGRADGAITEDSIAFTVKQRAENAVSKFNRQLRRSSFVKTQIIPRENGDFSVVMALAAERFPVAGDYVSFLAMRPQNPFMYAGCVAIFLYVIALKPAEIPWINRVAKHVLACYLIQSNNLFYRALWRFVNSHIPNQGFGYPLAVAVVVLALMSVCMTFDALLDAAGASIRRLAAAIRRR
jgi:hypothetical protein